MSASKQLTHQQDWQTGNTSNCRVAAELVAFYFYATTERAVLQRPEHLYL